MQVLLVQDEFPKEDIVRIPDTGEMPEAKINFEEHQLLESQQHFDNSKKRKFGGFLGLIGYYHHFVAQYDSIAWLMAIDGIITGQFQMGPKSGYRIPYPQDCYIAFQTLKYITIHRFLYIKLYNLKICEF